MKIATVVGIRPDVVRLAALIKKFDADPEIEHVLIHSGQHFQSELSDVFFKDLEVRAPDYNLGIGAPGKEHFEQVADLSVKLIKLAREIKPDLIVFLGDSNSVLASVPLKKSGFKIAHVESGMRAGPKAEWMPEEINRRAIDHVSSLLFAYTPGCVENLLKENIPSDRIFCVGNTIVEPLKKIADFSYEPEPKHIAVDIHRHENITDEGRLRAVMETAANLSKWTGYPAKMIAFPRTMRALGKDGFKIPVHWNVEFVDLMGYREFVRFQQESLVVFSDSGSSQEEAPLLGKPVIVPRPYTERPESVEAGCSFMLDPTPAETANAVDWLYAFDADKNDLSWLGSGNTSELVVAEIKKFLGRQ